MPVQPAPSHAYFTCFTGTTVLILPLDVYVVAGDASAASALTCRVPPPGFCQEKLGARGEFQEVDLLNIY
jgi:hypothetical protein